MKHLTILVPEGQTNLSSMAGTHEIFTEANNYQKKLGHRDVFTIELAGVSKMITAAADYFTVMPDKSISDIKETDLIIIPSFNHNYKGKAEKNNQLLIEWLNEQYKKGAEIASICTGAFLLAATGLLNGKTCSTHWAVADKFRALYPLVNLKPEHLITDDNGIYTNGGAYSFLNLVIYLVEKYYDRQTAIHCSKIFQIDINRQSQSEFIIFSGQKLHDDEQVKKAQQYIESRVDKKIAIEELCDSLAVARRNFDRRFIKATGNSPLEYIQRVKMEAAKKSLENKRKTINEVMYDVGYTDVKSFREVFKKITGMSPADYKAKYNKGN